MSKLTTIRRRIAYFITALVLVTSYPFAAMAQSPEETTPPPVTAETTAPEEPPLTYTYNPDTKTWDSEKWVFNATTGKYEPAPTPVIVEPEPAITTNGEEESGIDATAKSEADISAETNVNLNNDINSEAGSGDASVIKNTNGGNATTGDATVSATVMNSVNSSLGLDSNQKVATFTQDIMGDVKGDIMLYPMLLKELLESQIQDELNVNVQNNFNIENNLDLTAKTGDALVSTNTNAGNATSGNATAIANVVNVLNSMIATQQSFVGTINIYGNLEGDILIAPDFIPQMLAHNGGSEDSSIKVSQDNTTEIMNNVTAVAESGAAAILNNTNAGNATSGNADTNVVIFNLTGHEIVAKNSLLVFVNVLGQWVGVIVDAPVGATSAMLGNGVTTNKEIAPDLTVTAENNHGITNNIKVTAESGDAEVSYNTNAGNATSGQAKAAANIANISGSQFGISDWFGVLFINVFQNWYGSFGVDTAYGNSPTVANESTGTPPGVIEFIPKDEGTSRTVARTTYIDSRLVAQAAVAESAVESETTAPVALGSSTGTPTNSSQPQPIGQLFKEATYDYRLLIAGGSILLFGLSMVGLRRLLSSGKATNVAGLD